MNDDFEFDPPEELKSWLEQFDADSKFAHYILVNGKIKKVNFLEAARWNGDFKNRRIDVTDISNEPNYPEGEVISTVFLGIDHGRIFNKELGELPILFESMVFGGKYHQRGWRYSTYGEAKQGHWQIVDCIRAGEPPSVEFGERPIIELFFEMFKDDDDDEGEKE